MWVDVVIILIGFDGVGMVEGMFVGVIMGGFMVLLVFVVFGSVDEVFVMEIVMELVVLLFIFKFFRVCVDLGFLFLW